MPLYYESVNGWVCLLEGHPQGPITSEWLDLSAEDQALNMRLQRDAVFVDFTKLPEIELKNKTGECENS